MARFEHILRGLGSLIVGSVVMIGLALLYFIVTAWIVSFGVNVVVGNEPSADWVAVSAAILTIGGLVGSTYRSVAASQAQPPEDPYHGQEVA